LTVSSGAGKKSSSMRNATDLRQKVLQASLALIEEGGLDRLSMREVARKSGVSHQAPYYYFGDREAILAAIAGEGFSTLGQSFLRAVDQAGSEPAKALEAIGRAYVGFALRHPAYFKAMFRADAVPLDRYPDVRKLSDEAFGKLVETIGKVFADQPSAVRLTISVACWAMVHGLATLILEGTLARTIEIPRARQRQVANEVIGTFTSLLIKDRT
jgi:AcrR family transcriptional regulator